MRTVAIAGVGLIGGSFALALRQAGFDGSILGVRSRSADEALKLRVIDEAVSLDERVDQSGQGGGSVRKSGDEVPDSGEFGLGLAHTARLFLLLLSRWLDWHETSSIGCSLGAPLNQQFRLLR